MNRIEVLAPPVSRAVDAKSDLCGLLCSMICLLHCAGIPSLLWLFPFLSETHWLRQPIFRQCVAVVCMGVIIQTLAPRCRRHGFRGTASLATIGLTILFTATFILPDLCCGSSTTGVAEVRSIPVDSPAGRLSIGTEYCSYFGRPQDELHETFERIYLATPLITSEQLKLKLSISRMQMLESIYPWLSPFSAVLLIVSHRLTCRRQRAGIPRSCSA